MNIHERLKYLRNKLNLTTRDFGASINMSGGSITNMEKGTRNITDRTIHDICIRWNVRKEWLEYGGTDDQIFHKLTNDEEIALCASELLEKQNDAIYNDIIAFIKIYRKLDDTSKETLQNVRDKFLESIKTRKT